MSKSRISRTVLSLVGIASAAAVIVLAAGVAAPGRNIAAAAAAAPETAVPAAQIAERRQLTGAEIRERIVGRMLHWVRDRDNGSKAELWAVMRPDGSMLSKCEFYHGRSYSWRRCTGAAIGVTYEGWANGVWKIEGDLMCSQTGVATLTGMICYRMYDGGGGIFVEKASGERKSSLPGSVDVRAAENIRCVGNLPQKEC